MITLLCSVSAPSPPVNGLDRSKKIWYEMDKEGIERDGIAERKNPGRLG
jgi:hypothetical protein